VAGADPEDSVEVDERPPAVKLDLLMTRPKDPRQAHRSWPAWVGGSGEALAQSLQHRETFDK
jgi:hypothetical protein